MVTDKIAQRILKTYKEAWVEQDIDKILSIFAEDGTYHERVFEKPFRGHKQIAGYWKRKVCEEQSKIKFKLLNYYICGEVIIAEWDATFYSNIKHAKIRMKEVGIFEIKRNKIKSLREYWQSKKL